LKNPYIEKIKDRGTDTMYIIPSIVLPI